jgi:hypothetical protein
MLWYFGPTTRTERETVTHSVGICRVGRVGSVVTRRDQLHEVGVPSTPPLVKMPTLTTGSPQQTRHRTPTLPRHPPTPKGGPKAVNDYILPYVWNFLDRCVDIRAYFFAFYPSWGLFAPENVLLQVSCMVQSFTGVRKKLPLVWILANLRLFFAFAVFFTCDAAFPQGSVSLPPALCYLK